MTIPTTTIFIRPGTTSATWTYANTSIGASAIDAVSFVFSSTAQEQIDRGNFQYSVDGGASWTTYSTPTDTYGTWVPASALWRFADQDPNELLGGGNCTIGWKFADGSMAASDMFVMVDDQPVGVADASGSILSTLHAGEAVTVLQAIDNGDPYHGRWVIENQSQPGLFTLSTDATTGETSLVVANAAAMPSVDSAATVTVHYYDHFQLDANGNPLPNTGVSSTMAFTVVPGTSNGLASFGHDLGVGFASGASAQPVLTTLSNGSIALAWQSGASDIWTDVRDASGNPTGQTMHLTSSMDATTEGQPAIAALANGRYVVAYSVQDAAYDSHVAYRIVEANGSAGAEINASGASTSASMPSVTGLSDGSFELVWVDGGSLSMKHVDASGVGGQASSVAANGIVTSPHLAVLSNGAFVLTWGQSDDGNVYAQVGGAAGPVIQVTSDGAAANNLTAAPLPHVTALAGGGFVVAWDSYSNDTRGFSMSDIFFQRYDNAGNALGGVEQANIDSGAGRFDAEVAASSDGGFIIEWQAADADGSGIFGRRFGADGSAIDGHEFQVNEHAQYDQSGPAVTTTANGGFASAWIDDAGIGGKTIEMRVLAGTSATGSSGGSGGAVSPQPGTSTGSGSTGSGSTGSGSTGSGSGSTGSTGSGSTGSGSTGSGSTGGSGSGTGVTTPTPEKLVGTSGANVFASGSGSHAIDGGDGVDTVTYTDAHTSFTVTASASGLSVTGGAGAVQDSLVNVERVQFSDVSLAFDVNGTAGEAYRLYQAAFDRAPDAAGLGYWIKALDSGMALDQVSAGFVQSKEFGDLYGASASDTQFVDALYDNVLHRAGDTAGHDFWVTAIEQHGVSRETVLSNFSESGENQAQVIGTIQHGMQFLPWA
jgi:hypothetical protein